MKHPKVGIVGLGLIGGSFAQAATRAGHRVAAWNRTRATSGGKFVGANVSLAAGAPSWVKDVGVKNGEIVLTVKRKGFVVFVR